MAVAARATRPVLAALDVAVERPRRTLAALMLAQIVATLGFGLLAATHNGWVWFQGGDQIWFTSGAWAIGHGVLPPGDISPGWGIVLIPGAWLAGATFVQQLPFVLLLNVLVLGPLALWSLWEIASRIGGRALALWTCVLWIVAPTVAIPLFVERYHERWIDQFVPQGIGLTAMADYPSMVAGLAIAALVVRAIDLRSWTDAGAAGAVLALAILMKPPNGLLAVGALLALLVARRWLELACFSAIGAAGVVALAVFKVRTQGELPLLGLDETRLALGAVGAIDVQRWLDADWRRYVELDVEHWRAQMAQLREYFWSARLFQWAPLAGVVAVARFRPAVAVLLAGWLAAIVVVKGTSTEASIEANTFWRLLMPAWPAYLLLLAAIAVLVPTLWRTLGERRTARPQGGRALPAPALAASVAGLVAVPLALVTLLPPLAEGQDDFLLHVEGAATTLVPVDPELSLTATRGPRGVTLRWQRDWRATVSYRVYRTAGRSPDGDVSCVSFGGGGAIRCSLVSPQVGVTRTTRWTDPAPQPGAVYRVAAAVRYDGGVVGSDVFAYSPPSVTPAPGR